MQSVTTKRLLIQQVDKNRLSLFLFLYKNISADMQVPVFNMQSRNWWIASLVYHRESKTKQTNEHNKSEKRSKSEKTDQE